MTFDPAVVQRVGHAFFQVAEEAEEVDRAADAEPEGGEERHDAGDYQCRDQIPVSPPVDGPGRNPVPDDRSDEQDEEAVNEAVKLAKKFGTEESAKFINGILGNISRS